jgi:hypothetical protein
MRKAKVLYLDENFDMVRNKKGVKIENNFTLIRNPDEQCDLKLVDIGYQNSGSFYIFEDNEGHKYYMSSGLFKEYIRRKPIEFKDVEWDVYQQGTIYSIHFK